MFLASIAIRLSSLGCPGCKSHSQCCCISAQSWKLEHDWDNYRKTKKKKKTLFSEALWWSFKLRRSCSALPAAASLESLDDTGNRSVESKNGRRPSPTAIVSRPSHPFFPSHSCFTRGTWQLVAGNVHVTEVRVAWRHIELWEIPGREALEVIRATGCLKVSVSYWNG